MQPSVPEKAGQTLGFSAGGSTADCGEVFWRIASIDVVVQSPLVLDVLRDDQGLAIVNAGGDAGEAVTGGHNFKLQAVT